MAARIGLGETNKQNQPGTSPKSDCPSAISMRREEMSVTEWCFSRLAFRRVLFPRPNHWSQQEF